MCIEEHLPEDTCAMIKLINRYLAEINQIPRIMVGVSNDRDMSGFSVDQVVHAALVCGHIKVEL